MPSPSRSTPRGARAFRTGDWGYTGADGGIWFRGRADSQIKLRGFRIELEGVRHVVLQYPGIVDAVIAVVSATGEKSLCAYVVSDEPIDGKALQEFTARSLPRYSVPSYVVRMAGRPVTKNGKTDYAALPPISTAVVEVLEAAPTGDVAIALQEIWRALLNRSAPIGAQQDFLELGGNSLLFLQLQLKIFARFQLKLPFAKLAVHSSFTRMTDYIETALKRERRTVGAS